MSVESRFRTLPRSPSPPFFDGFMSGGSMGFSIVVLESDPRVAQSLAGKLSPHFHAVHLTRSGDELRERVRKNRPEAVVLDMENSRLTDVQGLRNDFPALPIVCTHRVPDEELWTAA